jgi:epoxyqueuosine reductase QueG
MNSYNLLPPSPEKPPLNSFSIGSKYPKRTRYELSDSLTSLPGWLTEWMEAHEISLWAVADLRAFSTPLDETGHKFPYAISWAIPMNPHIMVSIRNGPNQAYAAEYTRVNSHVNKLSEALAAEIKVRGFLSKPLAVSDRTDPVNVKGDFPHKTAATRADSGWIGRHCQLITRPFGSWIRLGTVFTGIEIPCGSPIERSFCGRCIRCVEDLSSESINGQCLASGIAASRDIVGSGL